LREQLERHDPLAAWRPDATSADGYASEAKLAATDLQHVHGLGHARAVVADAIDRLHPGFFAAAARADAGDLKSRLARIARAIWDTYGTVVPPPRDRRSPRLVDADASSLPARPVLADADALVGWLRAVERSLEAEERSDLKPTALDEHVRTELVAVVDEYTGASPDQREAGRLGFARFRLVRYQLSGLATAELRILMDASTATDATHDALSRLLFAESLLDGGLDWRDELLVLRDARQHAERLGLPFASLTRTAAAASTEHAARLLLGVIDEGR
jgi:hypothetical protein